MTCLNSSALGCNSGSRLEQHQAAAHHSSGRVAWCLYRATSSSLRPRGTFDPWYSNSSRSWRRELRSRNFSPQSRDWRSSISSCGSSAEKSIAWVILVILKAHFPCEMARPSPPEEPLHAELEAGEKKHPQVGRIDAVSLTRPGEERGENGARRLHCCGNSHRGGPPLRR